MPSSWNLVSQGVPVGTIANTEIASTRDAELNVGFVANNPSLADPTVGLSLTAAAGTSTFAAATYHVRYSAINATGSSNISPDESVAVTGATQEITTSVTLPSGSTGINLFVGTTAAALELASVSNAGTVTYSGGLSAGVTAAVSTNSAGFTVLSLTITAPASGTGAAQPTTNTTTPATIHAYVTVTNYYTGSSYNVPVNDGTPITPGTPYTLSWPSPAGAVFSLGVDTACTITSHSFFKYYPLHN